MCFIPKFHRFNITFLLNTTTLHGAARAKLIDGTGLAEADGGVGHPSKRARRTGAVEKGDRPCETDSHPRAFGRLCGAFVTKAIRWTCHFHRAVCAERTLRAGDRYGAA